jgi:RNA polymerase sigma-70 factor, ECF subfamily
MLAELTLAVDRDRDLVAALQGRAPFAVERFVSAYGSRAYRLAFGITRSAPDAEEVVQDAIWSAVRKIDTFRAESTFGSWFYRIVVNAAYHTLRKRGRRAEVPLDDALPADGAAAKPVGDAHATVEAGANDAHLRHELSAAIDALPPAYRGVLVLRDVEGLSNAEVAAAMHITLANAKSRVHRARMFVRRRLAPFFPGRELAEAASA